jgi:hypothetical protein
MPCLVEIGARGAELGPMEDGLAADEFGEDFFKFGWGGEGWLHLPIP